MTASKRRKNELSAFPGGIVLAIILVAVIRYEHAGAGERMIYIAALIGGLALLIGVLWLGAARRRKRQQEWEAAAAQMRVEREREQERLRVDAECERQRLRALLASVGRAGRQVKNLSPIELEEFAAQVFLDKGYKVELTQETRDGGIDVYMVNPLKKVELVQCKQWDHPVGVAEVRALAGVVHHEKAVVGYLFAPGGFTSDARKWAEREPVVLMDEGEILRMMVKEIMIS